MKRHFFGSAQKHAQGEQRRQRPTSRPVDQVAQGPQLVRTDRPLLSASKAAVRLGVTPWTVYRLMRDHELPFVKVGSVYRFDQDELEAWIDTRRQCNSQATEALLRLSAR